MRVLRVILIRVVRGRDQFPDKTRCLVKKLTHNIITVKEGRQEKGSRRLVVNMYAPLISLSQCLSMTTKAREILSDLKEEKKMKRKSKFSVSRQSLFMP